MRLNLATREHFGIVSRHPGVNRDKSYYGFLKILPGELADDGRSPSPHGEKAREASLFTLIAPLSPPTWAGLAVA